MTTNKIPTNCDEIRKSFVNYFEQRGHKFVASSSLIPANDNTLLFTNAGMVQFKDIFLGKEKRSYKRAVTCQKCVRAGGKHNDLENVGYTKRHHTFFEMLGNFSFGDYFKREAIQYAWDFLTQALKINPEKLWITVHHNDEEAAKIWLDEIKINPKHFSKCGDKDNFWAMGEIGPCGYCSEIYYDYGATFAGDPPGYVAGESPKCDFLNSSSSSLGIPQGASERATGVYKDIHEDCERNLQHSGSPKCDEDERYVEIWNLVFMEFERDQQGKLTKLPNPSIDTGMGLERIAAVMQEEITHGDNYEIDIFRKVVNEAFNAINIKDVFGKYIKSGQAKITDIAEIKAPDSLPIKNVEIIDPKLRLAMRVVCDHARAAAFLIADGLAPSNEGRGYVLRKIIRRAVRFLYLLGFRRSFFWQFAKIWAKSELMGNEQYYPELVAAATGENKSSIELIIKNEEDQFIKTLERGIDKFEEIISNLSGSNIIPGAQVFYLYDTFGFPLEVTKEMAKEKNLAVDEDGFNQELEKQRQNSRAASVGKFAASGLKLDISGATKFVGYTQDECDSEIIALYKTDGTKTNTLAKDEEGIIILDVTPFYAESGGQVGDSGEIFFADDGFFLVEDTKKYGSVHLHYGKMIKGNLTLKQNIHAVINTDRHQAIKLNHSAAHLLHKAIRMVLGEHATQRGSLVDDKRLRFDITHFAAMTSEEIKEIECIVNQQIRNNLIVTTEEKSLQQAKAEGVMALFDEKYGEVVRVVKMGDFSAELCGGTHVTRTGDIGIFKIIIETSIAAGVRRVEAATGENARLWYEENVSNYNAITQMLKTDHKQTIPRIQQLIAANTALEKEIKKLQANALTAQGDDFMRDVIEVNGTKILVKEMPNADAKTLRQAVDQFKQKLPSAIILLATVQNDKAHLIVGVTPDCLDKIKANEIIQYIVPKLDGSGGGRSEMAQGGGTNVAALADSLADVRTWIERIIVND